MNVNVHTDTQSGRLCCDRSLKGIGTVPGIIYQRISQGTRKLHTEMVREDEK
jgi:hypothetical protein